MRTADFSFDLPPELIAQHPAARRDESRLLVLDRSRRDIQHQLFPDLLQHLRRGDVLVLNNSRVIPARLRGVNSNTGGRFEIMLLEEHARNDWWAMMKPGKRARAGTQIQLETADPKRARILATVTDTNDEGHRRLQFTNTDDIANELEAIGEIPLPPYIRRAAGSPGGSPEDHDRYQTVYAQPRGSVAAPTAGLHFTPELLARIRELGVEVCFVTLHVGLGTFAPVKSETLAAHVMHEERYEISSATATAITAARRAGRRVVAVGTTSVRVLESAAPAPDAIQAGPGRTRIFIHPPYEFKIVDALITNFHLPCSTLLMLVSAFAAPGSVLGRDRILSAYAAAVRERYRFFSYGDAMLIV
jgi:S-adenosylmethionine:tRNA ribosyltransferase-isomerase